MLAIVLDPVMWVIGRLPTTTERQARGVADFPVSAFFRNPPVLALGSVVGVPNSRSPAAYAFAKIRFAGRDRSSR